MTAKTVAKTKKKPSRNKPCPCGSGRKYKKCCGLKERVESYGGKLDNAVAKALQRKPGDIKSKDPLAGIPKEELLHRDQVIILAQHETKQTLVRMDQAHLTVLENYIKELRTFINAQPESEGRSGALGDIAVQLKSLEDQRAATAFSRPNEILMYSLQALLGRINIVPHKGGGYEIAESEDRMMEKKLAVAATEPSPEIAEPVKNSSSDTPINKNINEKLEAGEPVEIGDDMDDPKETTESTTPMPRDTEIKTEGGGESERQLDKDFDTEDTV
jgi:hypothetical protein